MEQYEKKGYLNSEFRLFHLTDQETKEVDYHYHPWQSKLHDRGPFLRSETL